LRCAFWGGWDAGEVESAEVVVVLSLDAFSFEDLDRDDLLVVLVGGENLRSLGWDLGLTRDDGCHHTAEGLDTERQRCQVDQDNLVVRVHLSAEIRSHDRSALTNGLIRVDASIDLLAVEKL